MDFFNVIYAVILSATLFVQLATLRNHKKSLVGNLLIYSFAATIFLGLIRVLFFVVDSGYLRVGETTLMICWHIMFYLTISTFLTATRTLVKIINVNTQQRLGNPYLITVGIGALVLLIFPLAYHIDSRLSPLFMDSLYDRSGLLHFIAFAFAALAGYDLNIIRKKFTGNIGVISLPLTISLAFLSIMHLWELLVESWKIIHVSGEFGEHIEKILWIPVFTFIFCAFFLLKRSVQLKFNDEQNYPTDLQA